MGIESVEDLREVGAEMAYRMVAHRHPGTPTTLLVALVGALEDRHWLSVSADETREILARAEGPLDVGPERG